jgi:hypothetical protein
VSWRLWEYLFSSKRSNFLRDVRIGDPLLYFHSVVCLKLMAFSGDAGNRCPSATEGKHKDRCGMYGRV